MTIDIIVPIYEGFEELKVCLDSVINSAIKTPYELILVEDGSPNPHIPGFLQKFATEHHATLLINERNLGFVATVNRGMALHPDRDIVLLNSDTEVANNWLDRLMQCAHSDSSIATVTPFSNNATICSFPIFCESNKLPYGHNTASLDAIFSTANPGRTIDIPTAVGFCMYIKRTALHQVGLFDVEHFGRGYGEENDFCMRVVKHGMRNVLCCDTFVFHEGGVSFSNEKLELMQNAEKVIHKLHPDYHQLVQDHVALDPARVFRLSTAIQLLHKTQRPKILAVTHHLNGGIEKHIQDLAAYLDTAADFILLKPINEHTIVLYMDGLHSSLPLTFDLLKNDTALESLLKYLEITRMHFHHAMGVPEQIWQLPRLLNISYDITLHDHFFINGNPAQCDEKGYFTEDSAAQSTPFPLPIPLSDWQELQKQHLAHADRIISPSAFTAALYKKHYHGLNITETYHPDWEQEAPYPATIISSVAENESLKVLVLGAISPEKGADIFEQTALQAKDQNLPLEFHMLGYAYRPLAKIIYEHGSYHHNNVLDLIHQIQPHLVWFPALIPETFSYTLSEALMAGLPVLAPDIGAFPQRLKSRPATWVESWNQSPKDWCKKLLSIRHELTELEHEVAIKWDTQEIPDKKFYSTEYLVTNDFELTHDDIKVDLNWLAQHFEQQAQTSLKEPALGKKEKLLQYLLQLKRSTIGRKVSRLIPFQTQKNIKRRLTSKSLHEIEK